MGRRRGRPTTAPVTLQRIDGHLTFGPAETWAWFLLPNSRWAFRSDGERRTSVLDLTSRLAGLGGRRLHVRVTSRPYPAAAWARALDQRTPAPLPGVPGETWSDHLVRAQRHVRASTMAEKEVYLGVLLTDVSGMSSRLLGRARGPARDKLEREAALVAETVAGAGLGGRPASARELEWLLHRSLGLGLPAPGALSPVSDGTWSSEDLYEITDSVVCTADPFAQTVAVTRRGHGAPPVTRHVAVLSVGRMEEIEVPDPAQDPWISFVDRLPFPVEWSIRLDVLDGTAATQAVQRKLMVIRDMQRHYREHDLDEPLALERQASQARNIEDQMATGGDVSSTRVHGWFRLAVSGATEEQCMDRVRAVVDAYRKRRVSIAHPKGQFALLREFTPCEPLATTAYRRRLPALYFAAGVPAATATVGDRRGPYLGYTTAGARRAVMFDTHYSTEVRETSGLVPIVGALGSGKSVLAGLITYEAVRRGITSVMLDPSGPMANLCTVPELRDHARHIDLTTAPAGTLNPYAVVAEPKLADYPTRDALEEARTLAAQDRKLLALDVTTMLLPPALAAAPRTRMLLAEAVRATKGSPSTSLWSVVELLEARKDGDAGDIAAFLRDMAELPLARLFFPVGPANDRQGVGSETLTVLTMPGLVLPPAGVARDHWSTSEQLAVPLLHLASWYATRAIYGRPRSERKLVALDEALALDTPLPTPQGWTTMGEVRAGDQLIGSQGLPTTVLGVTEVMTDRRCFRVSFEDGSSVIASENHRWYVRLAARMQPTGRVLTTGEMHGWASRDRANAGDVRFRVPVQAAAKTPEVELPLDPYTLGLWLGDGSRGQGYISATEEDAAEYMERIRTAGLHAHYMPGSGGRVGRVALTHSRAGRPRAERSALTVLRDLGVLDSKHVPAAYLRASIDQRIELLRGLMDSDGHVNRGDGFCTFVNSAPELVDGIVELLRSLGQTPRVRRTADPRSRTGGYWRVGFQPADLNPFHLRRKADRVRSAPRGLRSAWMSITAIEPVESVPVRCVEVDADDHLFVAGTGWKLTHNCHFLADWGAGRSLFTRLGRDSRKWNACVLAASQNPGDVLGMEVSNFIAAAFVGRIEDDQMASDALRMLRVPAGVGYEAVLSRLSPRDARGDRSGLREFVMRDVDGNVDRIRVDLDHLQHLLAALDTTAVPHPNSSDGESDLAPLAVPPDPAAAVAVDHAAEPVEQDLHADVRDPEPDADHTDGRRPQRHEPHRHEPDGDRRGTAQPDGDQDGDQDGGQDGGQPDADHPDPQPAPVPGRLPVLIDVREGLPDERELVGARDVPVQAHQGARELPAEAPRADGLDRRPAVGWPEPAANGAESANGAQAGDVRDGMHVG